MKRIFFLILSSLLLFAGRTKAQIVQQVSPDAFEKGLDNKNVQILDVRTAAEYQTGHLQHALQADWNNIEQFKDRVQHLDRTRPIFVYCLSGGRSFAASQWLQQQGYTTINTLKGGLNAWKQANKPVEASANIKQLNMDEYRALMSGTDTYLVDFGAEWCPPCKKMEPVLEALKKQAGDHLRIIKVDGGIHLQVMKELNVEALPVFIIYKNGKEVWRKQGLTALEEFKSHI